MAKFIDDSVMNKALDSGKLIGKSEPTRDTKFSWYGVYLFEGCLIAIVFQAPDDWAICAEEITKDELPLYVDDLPAALAHLS